MIVNPLSLSVGKGVFSYNKINSLKFVFELGFILKGGEYFYII